MKASYNNTEDISELDKSSSSYNEALGQINRLSSSWQRCHECYRKGNYAEWNKELEIIYEELYADVIEYDMDEEKTKFEAYNKLLPKYVNDKKRIHIILKAKAKLLRIIQEKAGKGSKREKHYDKLM